MTIARTQHCKEDICRTVFRHEETCLCTKQRQEVPPAWSSSHGQEVSGISQEDFEIFANLLLLPDYQIDQQILADTTATPSTTEKSLPGESFTVKKRKIDFWTETSLKEKKEENSAGATPSYDEQDQKQQKRQRTRDSRSTSGPNYHGENGKREDLTALAPAPSAAAGHHSTSSSPTNVIPNRTPDLEKLVDQWEAFIKQEDTDVVNNSSVFCPPHQDSTSFSIDEASSSYTTLSSGVPRQYPEWTCSPRMSHCFQKPSHQGDMSSSANGSFDGRGNVHNKKSTWLSPNTHHQHHFHPYSHEVPRTENILPFSLLGDGHSNNGLSDEQLFLPPAYPPVPPLNKATLLPINDSHTMSSDSPRCGMTSGNRKYHESPSRSNPFSSPHRNHPHQTRPHCSPKATLPPQSVQSPRLVSYPCNDHPASFRSKISPSDSIQPYKCRPILSLAMEQDGNWLSEFLCFVRSECVEVFSADQKEVNARMNSKKVMLGQVGIRCRFCAHCGHRARAGRSSSFPSSLSRIYQSLTMMLRDHFTQCEHMPYDVKEKYTRLRANASQGATDSKRYWVESARDLGLIDTEKKGIRFGK